MKKFALLTTILLVFIFGSSISIFAQKSSENIITIPEAASETEADTQAPEEPAPVAESGQIPLQNQPPSLTAQKVITSNMSCVKVGEARDEDKSAECNKPPQTDGGFIGPIGSPTLVNCSEDYLSGAPLMCIKPAYVFYCQGDPRWGNYCSMAQAGCGPTTMAMIFSSYGDTLTPLQMDRDIFQKRGWRACGDNVSYMQTAIQTLLPENGYEYHALGAPLDLTRAQEYLNAGYLIIGSTFGHIFVIDGVDVANQTLRLRDPGRCENKDGVIRSASTPWGGQRLIYSYAVKKIVK